MAQDITRGLLLMHSQGVLHRDMKSLNILLDKDMTAKISDFGLSKIKTKSQTTSSNLYVQNNVFGSLLWKAPETFSFKNPYTDKADIYALGIVFWEIASCQVPYEGFDAETIKDSVKSGERLDIPSNCPVEFKELIELCWNQEPKQRPKASNVFDKISQIIGQIPIFDSENLTSSVPQLSGSNPDPVITLQEVPKINLIITGSTPNPLVTDNQSVQNKEESEIERKIKLAQEKQQFLLLQKKKSEEEEQKRKLDEIEKENQRIEKEMKEEQEKKMKAEEERKKREEEQRKQKEEYERIGKWKSTKAPDFESNIFEAAAKGKLTSIIYLLANGTNVNEKYQNNEYDGWLMKNSTPLHFSSRYGHLSVVEYIVNQKADMNAKDKDNFTPLHRAAHFGHLNVVEYLVNQKADINAKSTNVEFLYLILLLFIMLLIVVILVLLNI